MDNPVVVIIIFILGIAAIALVAVYLYRRNNPKQEKPKGPANGTGRAVAAMHSFARSNRFRFIAPAKLQRGENTAQLDAIVVGYFGIIGLKALGYNGEIYGEASDKKWLQVTSSGSRIYFDNPILQAAADVRVIRDALFAKKLKKVPVEVVCVFTDPKVQLALPRSTGHLTVKELRGRLAKDKYLEDTGLDLDAVEGALRDALVP